MTPRAFYKRQSRQFKPGDKVTWGNGSVPCTVIEVKATGLVLKDLTVDTTVSRPELLRLLLSLPFLPIHNPTPYHPLPNSP